MRFSINTYLILIAVILFVVDFFAPTEVLTYASFLIITFIIAKDVPLEINDPVTSLLVRVLIAIAVLAGLIVLHYKVFRKFNRVIIDKYIAPDKRKDGQDGLFGKVGEIKEVDGKLFIKFNDEILQFTSEDSFEDKDKAKVVGSSGGNLIITKIK